MFRTAARILAALLGAAALVGTSVAAASVSPVRSSSRHGTERLVIMGASVKSSLGTVIATGLFTDAGAFNLYSKKSEIKLGAGEFRFHFKYGPTKQKFSSSTCLHTITVRGTYTLSHGTGKYVGISGSGRFTTSLRQVSRRNARGACGPHSLGYQAIITLHGPVTLRS